MTFAALAWIDLVHASGRLGKGQERPSGGVLAHGRCCCVMPGFADGLSQASRCAAPAAAAGYQRPREAGGEADGWRRPPLSYPSPVAAQAGLPVQRATWQEVGDLGAHHLHHLLERLLHPAHGDLQHPRDPYQGKAIISQSITNFLVILCQVYHMHVVVCMGQASFSTLEGTVSRTLCVASCLWESQIIPIGVQTL